MIRKGDEVTIRPEWRDQGDEEFTWVACDDEEKGRVTITPVNTGLAIPPRQTVSVEMLKQNKLCTRMEYADWEG
jgi:hypothetical protein